MAANSWKKAQSVAELGSLMADWLEGRISTAPLIVGDDGPDDETRHLIPILAACNRAGFVTTCSQPGHPPERGHDGRMWRQRAAVEGWVADRRLLDRLRAGAKRAGIDVIAHQPGVKWHDGIPVTDADREPYTWFARTDGHRKQIAYEWGRDDRLWPVLQQAINQ